MAYLLSLWTAAYHPFSEQQTHSELFEDLNHDVVGDYKVVFCKQRLIKLYPRGMLPFMTSKLYLISLKKRQGTSKTYSDFLMVFIINRPKAKLLTMVHFPSHCILPPSLAVATLACSEAEQGQPMLRTLAPNSFHWGLSFPRVCMLGFFFFLSSLFSRLLPRKASVDHYSCSSLHGPPTRIPGLPPLSSYYSRCGVRPGDSPPFLPCSQVMLVSRG